MGAPATATGAALERLGPEHQEAFLAAVRASPHIRPFADPPRDRPSFARWLERAGGDGHESYLVVRSDGALAGYVNVNDIVRGPARSAHLAWAGFTGSLGRGLMTAAVGAALHECFRRLRLEPGTPGAALPF